MDCGGRFHPVAMDFDHVQEKTLSVGTLVSAGFSEKRIEEEISKCELVCANCHRIRTYKRLKGAG